MPSILSKLVNVILQPEWVFKFNCYEIGHTWAADCSDAATDMGAICFREGLKMYSGLYLLSHLVFHRGDIMSMRSAEQILYSVLRSSAFLGFNAWAVFTAFCGLRKLSDRFYYTICASMPAFVGSLAAIYVERPSRRAALAVYCANIASECLFKIAVSRGYFRPIPHGEVALFTLAMGILLYLVKVNGFGQDPVSLAIRFLLGGEEAAKRRRSRKPKASDGAPGDEEVAGSGHTGHLPATEATSDVSSGSHADVGLIARHASCPHNESCLSYAIKGFLQPFAAGWLGQSLFSTVLGAQRSLRHAGRGPGDVSRTILSLLHSKLVSTHSLRFGAFLGGFALVYKAANCGQRRALNRSADWQALVAGFLAGPTMLLAPNATFTLYVTWKCIEALYCAGLKAGYCKYPMPTITCLYAASVAVLFFTSIMEPSSLRGSYMRFLDRVTDHRLHLLNRNLLEVFGTGASVGYEDFFPDLHPRLVSRHFMETVFLWSL